jgi:hypothetical protein
MMTIRGNDVPRVNCLILKDSYLLMKREDDVPTPKLGLLEGVVKLG